jgi:hypothetical protein
MHKLSKFRNADFSPLQVGFLSTDSAEVPFPKGGAHGESAVPSGLGGLITRVPKAEALGYFRTSLRDENGILVALDFSPQQRSKCIKCRESHRSPSKIEACCGLKSALRGR